MAPLTLAHALPLVCAAMLSCSPRAAALLTRLASPISQGRPVSTVWSRPYLKMTVCSTAETNSDDPRQIISARVRRALVQAFGEDGKHVDASITVATKPEFGDYQCNAAMPLAKVLNTRPHTVADDIISNLDVSDVCYPPEIAGPGFINLRLKDEFVNNKVARMLADPLRLAIPAAKSPQKIVVDFSSPNIAKEMHVGHLRSTIIGDTLCRILEFLGHDVKRLNHVGDWGTQFGMLIRFLKETHPEALENVGNVNISDLVEFYKSAKQRFDGDVEFQENSRLEVVKLQSGDEENIRLWQALCDMSRVEYNKLYEMLGVSLEERGESFYNPFLDNVITDLEAKGLAVESEGATCVFLDGYKNRDGSPMPLIVRKTDGGYMYSTTDLAALRHRNDAEQADRILYVTDAGQSSHFDQVFQVAKKAGFVRPELELRHVPFGLVQGEDGKKFKTRSGTTVKLKDLLDEAVSVASADMRSRFEAEGLKFDEAAEEAARVVGIAAVKYADLSMNRESNYKFSYSKMLALTGNTAPYLLYAYVRIKGIQRKANVGVVTHKDLKLTEEAEIVLGKQLVKFGEVLREIERDLFPNKLCDYLYDLSVKFNQFYEQCPVNTAESSQVKKSRTALCQATASTLSLGLNLLGIDTVEKL